MRQQIRKGKSEKFTIRLNEAEATIICPKQAAKKIEEISKLFNEHCLRQISQHAAAGEKAANGEVQPVNAEQPADHEDADVAGPQPHQ